MILKTAELDKYVKAISGLFNYLTPKEMDMLIAMLLVAEGDPSTNRVFRKKVSQVTGHSGQVVTNYITRLRNKGAIVDNKLHPVFFLNELTIKYQVDEKKEGNM